MELVDLADVLGEQDGVVSWDQVVAHGGRGHDLERLLRRRQLVRVHPRVYVDHTGQLSWRQRAWAAVLWAAPAALSHLSAVQIGESAVHDDDPIHVAIAADRRLKEVPGVRVHRTRGLAGRLQDLSPPRVRLEDALLDVAAGARSDRAAVAVLADACGARRTTPARLLEHADRRTRLPRRDRLVAVLGDAASGTCSALEQAYVEVAGAHGLPEGRRQASHRHGTDQRYRDVLLEELLLCVELDGRLHHGAALARDDDLERDLDAVAEEDLLTVRLSWGQVVDRGCHTADRLGRILARRGWSGSVSPCAACRVAA